MKKTAALFSIIRPVNFLITFLVISAGYAISAENYFSFFVMFCAAISGALTAGAGNIVNDIFDIDSDKINHPNRPLASGRLTYNNAKVLWFFLTLLSFICSSFISNYAFLIILGIHVVLIMYSFILKSIPLIGNLVIALLAAAAFIYGAYAASNFNNILLPAAFAFMINYIREMVKDIQDLGGDMASGVLTFPGKYGIKNTKKVILTFIALLMILTLYPFFFQYYKIEYFIIIMIIVNPLLIYCVKLIKSGDEQKHYWTVSSVLKLNMAAGLLAIFLGQ